jgi:hypothetical protein
MGITYYKRKHSTEEEEITMEENSECCGAHTVCEKDSLLNTDDEVTYYDDEELDQLSGIPFQQFSEKQIQLLTDVFVTLSENDVAGWLRSLQIRNIALTPEIRDEALLIVRERRGL